MKRYLSTRRAVVTFLVGWIVVNLVGGAIGGSLEARYQFLGTLVLFGAPLGLAHWLLLRRYIPHAWRWALVLLLGWPFANVLTVYANPWLEPIVQALSATGLLWAVFWLNLVRWPVILLLIGLLQSLLLTPRRRTVPRWLLANLVGGMVVGAVSATVCYHFCGLITQQSGALLTNATLGASAWAAYALVTGPVLASLLCQRQRDIQVEKEF